MPFMEQARNEKQFSMARFINEVRFAAIKKTIFLLKN